MHACYIYLVTLDGDGGGGGGDDDGDGWWWSMKCDKSILNVSPRFNHVCIAHNSLYDEESESTETTYSIQRMTGWKLNNNSNNNAIIRIATMLQ